MQLRKDPIPRDATWIAIYHPELANQQTPTPHNPYPMPVIAADQARYFPAQDFTATGSGWVLRDDALLAAFTGGPSTDPDAEKTLELAATKIVELVAKIAAAQKALQ